MNADVLVWVIGFLVTVFVGWCLTHFVVRTWLRGSIRIPALSSDPVIQQQWVALTTQADSAGKWVGFLERIIVFVAAWMTAWPVIGAWLAFKVASKWQAWQQIGYIPHEVQGVPPLHYAYVRRVWAAQGNATFIVGTWMNVVVAVAGAYATRYVYECVP